MDARKDRFPMKLRVVSPFETIVKSAMVEVFAILFLLLLLRNLTPYRYFSVMQLLQYSLLGVVCLFILLPVGVELIGFGALRFLMNKRGITYKNRKTRYRLTWEDVQHIVLAPDLYGRVSKRSYLVFCADDEPQPVTGKSEFYERAFGLQFRKGLPEAIAKYYDVPIENLEMIQKKHR
jgi:hypothetical protein